MKLYNQIGLQQGGENRISLSDTDINIVFDGDSLTFGSNGNQNQDYPLYIKNRILTIANSTLFNSFGVSGQSTLDMISDASTQIDPLVDNTKYNIITAWEDVNAILNDGRTGQENFDDMEAYFAGRKNAGFDFGVLVVGYRPKKKNDGSYNQPTWTDARLDEQDNYRNLVLNASNPSWDVVVDLSIHPILGGNRGETINQFFYDSVHLTANGYEIAGEWIMQNGILDNFSS
jgi:hypothetical protein